MTIPSSWKHRFYAVLGWLPFTAGGALFFFISLMAVLWLGIGRSDLIVIVIGVVGCSVSLIGLFVTLLAGVVCWWRLRSISAAGKIMLSVGVAEQTPFQLPVPWWVPLVQSDWSWSKKHFSVGVTGQREDVTATRRGSWKSIVREVTISDAFGVCSVRFVHEQSAMLTVIPNTQRLQQPKLLHGLQAGSEFFHPNGHPDGDRYNLRNYAVGDSMRHILWKVYARTGELVVRTPERAYQPSRKMLAYLVVAPDDGVAAGLATVVLQGDLLGQEWCFGVDGAATAINEREQAIAAVIQSGVSSAEPASGLFSFVQQNQEESSSLIVFAPARVGPWVEVVSAIAQRMPVRVFVGVHSVLEPSRFANLEKILLLPKTVLHREAVNRDEIRQVAESFQRSKVDLWIADQRVGDIFPAAHLQVAS